MSPTAEAPDGASRRRPCPGMSDPFCDAFLPQLVTVTASSCEFGNVNHAVAHHAFAAKHQTFMTESAPVHVGWRDGGMDDCVEGLGGGIVSVRHLLAQGSWLTVFLGVQYVLCPTAYTLKNCVINPCMRGTPLRL